MGDLVVPNKAVHDVSSYKILVNDAAVDASYQVLAISISKEIGRIPYALIIFRDRARRH